MGTELFRAGIALSAAVRWAGPATPTWARHVVELLNRWQLAHACGPRIDLEPSGAFPPVPILASVIASTNRFLLFMNRFLNSFNIFLNLLSIFSDGHFPRIGKE